VDEFVFGFGMDIDGMWRNLKDIHALRNPATIGY
jgi:hypoxanthine-guanine phosphoribosyltransferase